MQISGFFTPDELESAKTFGAVVETIRTSEFMLKFQSEVAYKQWMDNQKLNHPGRWIHQVNVIPK